MSERILCDLTPESVADFLYYGYIPEVNVDFLSGITDSLQIIDPDDPANDYGGPLLCDIVGDALVRHSREKRRINVVPLSGGLDSRALLGALLSHVDKKDIVTITFGSPRALDYEIGKQVAKTVGVEHLACDLTSDVWKWETSDLVNVAKSLSSPIWIFDRFVNDVVGRLHQDSGVYWSGFMGDPIAGSHLRSLPSNNWVEAAEYFSIKNKFDNSNLLVRDDYSPLMTLPKKPIVHSNVLSFDEQFDFSVRQGGFIRRVIESPGCKYEYPFLNKRWIASSLRLPASFRLNQRHYKRVLVESFPFLFSLPTKTYQGAPLSASRPRRVFTKVGNEILARFWGLFGRNYKKQRAVNYIDFDDALISRKELNDLARLNLADLKARQICDWVDVDAIWRLHNSGSKLGRAITLLISLEIYLKALEKK